MKFAVLPVLLAFLPISLWAWDVGLMLDQKAGIVIHDGDSSFEYSGSLTPRFSILLSDRSELYISAGMQLEYQDEKWELVPELLRTEFSLMFDNRRIRAGRMQYADPLGLIAEGLFDGGQFFLDTQAGIFSAGAWYTGLLYKRRANIAMTSDEQESINEPVWDDPDYFASRRMLWALEWEHPSIAEFIMARVALLGQFDLSDGSDLLHTQYLAGIISVPLGEFTFDLGGSLGLAQRDGNGEVSLAGELGASWMPPTSFGSRLSLLARYSSGVSEDESIHAFQPITTSFQGDVIKARFSGISMISLGYLARLHRSFAASLSSSYFFRNDLGSYGGFPVSEDSNSNYVLGNEFYGRVFWSPVSDFQINLGAGMFLPSMGNVAPDTSPLWRIDINLIFSIL